MMGSERSIIGHEGIVSSNTGNAVFVTISTTTACSGCHAKNSCNILGSETRLIEVKGNYEFSPGDSVNVLMQQSMGYTALLYGYVLPFFVMIATLLIMVSAGFTELAAGLASLAVLGPYYLGVYIFRKKINEKFIFKLKV